MQTKRDTLTEGKGVPRRRRARVGRGISAFAVAILASASGLGAITAVYHAGLGARDVVDETGRPLSDGQAVWVGTFAPAFDPAGQGADLGALRSAWRELGRTTTRSIAGQPGRFAGTASSAAGDLAGRPLHWWILRTVDGGAPEPDFENVASYGLFSSTLGGWLVPAVDAVPPENSRVLASSAANISCYGVVEAQHLRLALARRPVRLGLEAWRAAWFGADGSVPAAQDGADPDEDGLPNLAEYGLGLSPLRADAGAWGYRWETRAGRTGLVVLRPLRGDRPEVRWLVQASDDLRHWSTEEQAGLRVVAEAQQERTLELWLPVGGAFRFFQLQVTPAAAGAIQR